MKKNSFIYGCVTVFAISLLSNVLMSCATAMEFNKFTTLQTSIHGEHIEMEFIGFKGTYDTLGNDYNMWQNFKKDTVLARLGTVLQEEGIAYDQSFAYFGIYSLQEIATYKSKQRFVTFIETEKNNFTYVYNNKSQQTWGGVAGGLIGGSIPLLFLGGLWSGDEAVADLAAVYRNMGIGFSVAGVFCLIPALIPAKTTITFNGVYSIYVYDTINKEIIYKDTVNVGPMVDKYNGSYEHEYTDKNAIWAYYSTLAYNEIINKYGQIYQFIKTIK
jgi:hypothetical protein